MSILDLFRKTKDQGEEKIKEIKEEYDLKKEEKEKQKERMRELLGAWDFSPLYPEDEGEFLKTFSPIIQIVLLIIILVVTITK